MRLTLVHATLLAGGVMSAAAFAQQADDATPGRRNQKIERLVHEDAGARIEEVRYAGQTESITVQPKAPVPGYQVEPESQSRTPASDDRRGLSGSGGTRFWNVLKF
ncbi:MAG: hypothetical protein NVS2B4_01950 [Ramlibacter sp.]